MHSRGSPTLRAAPCHYIPIPVCENKEGEGGRGERRQPFGRGFGIVAGGSRSLFLPIPNPVCCVRDISHLSLAHTFQSREAPSNADNLCSTV